MARIEIVVVSSIRTTGFIIFIVSFVLPWMDAKQALCKRFDRKFYPSPKRVNENCYTGSGHDYRGRLNTSRDGRPCISWRENFNYLGGQTREKDSGGIGDHNFCRNPDRSDSGGPWCFVNVGLFSRCDVVACDKYFFDPLDVEPTRTCDRNKIEFVFPDVMFQFRGKVHYATRSNTKTYNIYNFLNGNMTALDSNPLGTSARSWNYCVQHNDTLTFVTSYDEEYLFAYFEKPDVMIRISFNPLPNWEELNSSVHENCTRKAKPSFDPRSFSAIRQVFSMEEPDAVLLLKNDEMIRCNWSNGVLTYVNSTKSPFGTCPSGSMHFIDGRGNLFRLYRSPATGHQSFDSDRIVLSTLSAVEEKPALAYPLLGYTPLNSKSLVTFREKGHDETCSEDAKNSRLYQIYEGRQIDDILIWVKRSTKQQAWLRIHDINIRKSSFCNDVTDASCCKHIVKQVLHEEHDKDIRIKNAIISDSGCENKMFLIYCKIEFATDNSSCPSISCYGNADGPITKGERVICEIPLADDPPCSVLLDDILGKAKGEFSFEDASEAVFLMDFIAASINYQNRNNSKVLSTLVDSVKALEVVDYSSLSPSGAQDLISDVVNVVDNIVDHETTDVWISLLGADSSDGPDITSTGAPSSEKATQHSKKISSPTEILFTVESVLQGIVSGQVLDNSTVGNSNFSVKLKTGNIISNIQVDAGQGESLEIGGSFVKFDDEKFESGVTRVAIVSQYPKLMQLIEKVDKYGQSKADSPRSCKGNTHRPHVAKEDFEFVPHSPVLSATLMKRGHKVSSRVTFAMPFTDNDVPDPQSRHSKFYFSCRYLTTETDDGHWKGRGCEVARVDHEKKLVYCSCNHTTNFAILLQVIPPKLKKEDLINLQTISFVGESISLLCLMLTLATFTVFRHSLKSARIVAHFHLVIALIIFHVTQLLASIAEEEKNSRISPCIAVAALTHFSLLASFCWMLVEGILLYMSVVNVFHSMKSMNVMRYIIGWVAPGIIAGVTMAYGLTRIPYPTCYLEGVGGMSCPVNQAKSDVTSGNADSSPGIQLIEWCWLSSSNFLIWTAVAPAIAAVATNTVILIRVTIVIAKTAKATNMYRPTSERKKEKHIRKCVKGAFILMPILGIPWTLGLIPQAASHVGMLYVFTLLNSIQGFFILLFYCILSSEVRSAFNRYLLRKNFFYSQNNTTNASGRQSVGENKYESGRSRNRSRLTSNSDLPREDTKTTSRRNEPTSSLPNEISEKAV